MAGGLCLLAKIMLFLDVNIVSKFQSVLKYDTFFTPFISFQKYGSEKIQNLQGILRYCVIEISIFWEFIISIIMFEEIAILIFKFILL